MTCKFIYENGSVCNNKVLTIANKNSKSNRVETYKTDKDKGFLWVYSKRKIISDYCYYHDKIMKERLFPSIEDKHARSRNI